MSEKFTPGPWIEDRFGRLRDEFGQEIIVSDLGISTRLSGHTEETIANGKLMKASKDLYEALKWCADVFSDDALHDMVFDALAKARD